MNHTKASMLVLVASICCTPPSLQAIEWKNLFKAAAAAALVTACAKITVDPNLATRVGSTVHAFADGVVSTGLLFAGTFGGGHAGYRVTSGNPAGAVVGFMAGGALGIGIATTVGGRSFDDRALLQSESLRLAEAVGCYCGGTAGWVAVHAVLDK